MTVDLLPSRIPPAPAMDTAASPAVLLDRGLAAGIDLALCYFLLEVPVIYLAGEVFPAAYAALDAGFVLSVAYLLPVYLTYSFAFEWRFSRTPGKVNRGLVVVMADGRPPTLRASAVRNLLRYVDLLGVPPLVVGLAVALVSDGRRLGDRAAGTLVVRARAPESEGLLGALDVDVENVENVDDGEGTEDGETIE